ncbi:hypothetical protein AAZX31_16G113500 [Glycine max]
MWLKFKFWFVFLFRGGVVRVGRWSLLGYCGEDDEKFLVVRVQLLKLP